MTNKHLAFDSSLHRDVRDALAARNTVRVRRRDLAGVRLNRRLPELVKSVVTAIAASRS